MKQNIFPAIKLSLLLLIVFAVVYPAIIWVAAQVAPNKGKGELAIVNGKVVGYANEAQNFTQDNYFWPRPSAVGYNAAGSGGSNKGPNNPDYLQVVKDRLDTFLVHNPTVKKEQVPVEMVTASGSGLDPDISPNAAYVQVARVAIARKIPENEVKNLIEKNTDKPLLVLFGTTKINVLKLNIALDELKK
ncbi:MAG: K(+)-transporting ATPase subunit C [Bacteroidota bacterium]